MIYFIVGYIIFLIIFAVFSTVSFYHIRRFGFRESASKTMMFFYSIISIAIVAVTFILLIFSGFSIPDTFQIGF